MRVVLHIDVDCFFVQCEVLRDPSLRDKAVAVQQHQDIIALSYEARALGIQKHINPAVLRQQHPKVQLVHVPTTAGGKVTYKDYRSHSRSIIQVLKRQGFEVERASIDDFYVEPKEGGSDTPSGWGRHLADTLREQILRETGFVVSVGVGPCKLLAKLCSSKAKPNGVHAVDPGLAVTELLKSVSATKLPGAG